MTGGWFYATETMTVYATPEWDGGDPQPGILQIATVSNAGEILGQVRVPFEAPLTAEGYFALVRRYLDAPPGEP